MRRFFRIVFSRYSICALLILLDILLMALLFEYAAGVSALGRVFSVLVFLSLINRDTNPEFKLTWLALAAVAPLFGSILYIILSQRYLTSSEKKFLRELYARIDRTRRAEDDDNAAACLNFLKMRDKDLCGRARALLECDSFASIYPEQVLEYYPSGEDMYSAMLGAIERAEKYIFLEYFVVEEGRMWSGIYERIRKKAAEGVDVRMLYDDIGSMKTLPASFDKRLRSEGIRCYRFSKVTPVLNSSHNNRDHRKILVVDGQIAFTGGINIADEYINARQKFGHWKDAGVSVEGRAALGFTRLFLIAFDLTVREFSDYEGLLSSPRDCSSAKDARGRVEYNAVTDRGAAVSQSARGFLIPIGSGPAPLYKESAGKEAFMSMINFAAEYLYITTPYLIVDYDLTEALRHAARRGVDVRIITPGIPDKPLINVMTKSSYPRLAEAGVRIFEYTPGFMHAKCAVADGKMAMVGSINLDYRSLVHHFEDALLIFSSRKILDVTEDFKRTEKKCTEVTDGHGVLTLKEKVLRSIMRVIAPLL